MNDIVSIIWTESDTNITLIQITYWTIIVRYFLMQTI